MSIMIKRWGSKNKENVVISIYIDIRESDNYFKLVENYVQRYLS